MTEDSKARKALALFESLVDADQGTWSERLDLECGDDHELKVQVERLLTLEEPGDFLGTPVATVESAQHETRLPAGYEIDDFVIEKMLGAGGMGEVYLATDRRLDRRVAIKVVTRGLHGDAWRLRLRTESRAISALNHPHIRALYDVGSSDSFDYLVMEYLEGETLAERLKKSGRLAEPEVSELALQIASALCAAHERGIVHRDLKPANILLTEAGVKVLDFGIAKFTSAARFKSGSDVDDTGGPATAPGALLGTASYMSPEQARAEDLDQRTDVWSFGCVLYEMLTGRRAFDGKTESDCLVACLEREPDWSALPASTTAGMRLLVERCLRKDRDRRLFHIADARLELEDEQLGVAGGRALSAADSGRRSARFLVFGLALLLLGALAAIVGLLVTSPRPHESPATLHGELSVTLPADAALVDDQTLPLSIGRPSIALSPDGKLLVYVAQRESADVRQLYMRRLDSFNVEPIAATDGAFAPFFSPDGEWIAFFAAERLHKISLRGGRPITLCAAPNPFGGTWGPDGDIVFATDFGSHLRTVSAHGGLSTLVTERRGELLGGLGGNFHWPQFLPGGKALIVGTGPLENSLEVLAMPGGERLAQIDEPGTGPLCAVPGHLLFGRAGDVYALPFDHETLEPTGPAFPAIEGVRTARFASGAAHQTTLAANGTIAYVPGPPLGLATLVWRDLAGEESTAVEGERVYGALQISPDGQDLAATVHDLILEVWIFAVAAEKTPRKLSGDEPSWAPVWSQDGDRIIHTALRDGSLTLLLRNADGSGEPDDLLAGWSGGHVNKPRDVSPDGEWLLFDAARSEGRGLDVWAYRFRDRSLHAVLASDENESAPTFSPDGDWIAYTSGDATGYSVYACPFPAGEPRLKLSRRRGEEPVWSTDGSRVFYRDGREWRAAHRDGSHVESLFRGPYLNAPGISYDFDTTRERFLLIRAKPLATAQREIRIIFGALEKLDGGAR